MVVRSCVIAAVAAGVGAVHSSLHPITVSFKQPSPTPTNATPATTTTPTPAPPKDSRLVSLARAKEIIAVGKADLGVQVIDAREPREFIAGRIPGAINLPPSAFSGGMPDLVMTLSRDLPVLVYCNGGDCDASLFVAKRLGDMGFSRMHIFEGGYAEWTKAGEPIEKDGGTP